MLVTSRLGNSLYTRFITSLYRKVSFVIVQVSEVNIETLVIVQGSPLCYYVCQSTRFYSVLTESMDSVNSVLANTLLILYYNCRGRWECSVSECILWLAGLCQASRGNCGPQSKRWNSYLKKCLSILALLNQLALLHCWSEPTLLGYHASSKCIFYLDRGILLSKVPYTVAWGTTFGLYIGVAFIEGLFCTNCSFGTWVPSRGGLYSGVAVKRGSTVVLKIYESIKWWILRRYAIFNFPNAAISVDCTGLEWIVQYK